MKAASKIARKAACAVMAVVLAVGCNMPALAYALEYSGDVVYLSSAADLAQFRDDVNSGNSALRNYTTVKLACDIDLKGSSANQWTPIGTVVPDSDPDKYSGTPRQGRGFYGTFDGQGHEITGLYIDSSEQTTSGQGLFALLESGSTVKDLVVKGQVSANDNCVGGVVAATGLTTGATVIENVGNEVAVRNTRTGNYVYAGGVLGYAGSSSVRLTGCYNKAAVETNRSYAYAGGISAYGGTIANCYNTGSLTARNSGISDTCIGGIAGSLASTGSITGCYNNSTVQPDRDVNFYGAVVGTGSNVESSYFNDGKTSKGYGGFSTLAGVIAYASAADLLASLGGSAPGTWKDGSQANASFDGTPALAWEKSPAASFAVTCGDSAHGTVSVSQAYAQAGTAVTISVVPDEGYVLDSVSVVDGAGQPVSVANMTFTMPGSNVAVSCAFRLAATAKHAIVGASAENGSFTLSASEALVNATVSVSPVPAAGYELDAVTVTKATGGTVAVSGTTFLMPDCDVTVSVTFKLATMLYTRITVSPAAGGTVPAGLQVKLVDRLGGAETAPTGVIASGANNIYEFSAANNHTYKVVAVSDLYEVIPPDEITIDEKRGATQTFTVQLGYKAASCTVTFDPGEGAFGAGSDADLTDGKVVRTVKNGSTTAAPTVDPVRDGYAFAGWQANGNRFLSYAPVSASVTYEALWVSPAQASGDTFLLDLGSGGRDGTRTKPYRVSTEQDLRDFACVVSGKQPLDDGWADFNGGEAYAFAGKFVSLEDDLQLVEAATPVGIGSLAPSGDWASRPFSGTFLGNDHVISNFFTSAESNPEFAGETTITSTLVTHHVANSYSALFGALSGATVQDLAVRLAGGKMTATAAAGGIAALAAGGTTRIGHCAVLGDIEITGGSAGSGVVGGLVGAYGLASAGIGSTGSLVIDHCAHVGSVVGTTSAGGLIGSADASGARVVASYQAGQVSASNRGGIIGGSAANGPSSTVDNCVIDSSIAVAGGAAASGCKAAGVVSGLAANAWSASAEVRAALGDDLFDFDNPYDGGAPSLARGCIWAATDGEGGSSGGSGDSGSDSGSGNSGGGSGSNDSGSGSGSGNSGGSSNPSQGGGNGSSSDTGQGSQQDSSGSNSEGNPNSEGDKANAPGEGADDQGGAGEAGATSGKASMAEASVGGLADKAYTGSAIVQEPVVSYGGKVLVRGLDYTVTISDNTNVGTARVKITGIGAFSGETIAHFSIVAVSIENAKVTLFRASAPYTGATQRGGVKSVGVGDRLLTEGIDYEVSSAKAGKKVGKYAATVSGIGGYTGKATAEFTITQATNKAVAKKTSVTSSLSATKLKKKAATVALPKVTTRFGSVRWSVSKKDAKSVLALKDGKIRVKRGAKPGSYTVKLKARVAATNNYKAASTKLVTVKVKVKK